MSQAPNLIATTLVACLVARLVAWPAIRRLRAQRADAVGFYAARAVADNARPAAVLPIDLGDFKLVNDTYGHEAGEDLLIEIGERITEVADLRSWTEARLSGDGFAVMLPLRDHEHGHVADLFVGKIARPVELAADDAPITVTVSIGATIVETTDPLEDFALRRADVAVYRAKHRGGNRYATYEPGTPMPTSAPSRGPRLRDLRQRYRGVTA
ncbi:GGDEF domain-containing protein [Micromonospora sp. CPCC 206061]|uniref:GGDEF domain-containing protein n=1 Tax=Micromonospora sp. CPCC 206061 TaxID=3122410 RepID=UPI002FF1915D